MNNNDYNNMMYLLFKKRLIHLENIMVISSDVKYRKMYMEYTSVICYLKIQINSSYGAFQ